MPIDPVRVLLTDNAYRRVASRLEVFSDALHVTTMQGDLRLCDARAGTDVAHPAPDLVWLSSDSHYAGQFAGLSELVLRASQVPGWVHTYNAGLDNPIYRKIMARGTRLTKNNTQAIPIAEYVVGHALSLLLPIAPQRILQHEHNWQRTPFHEVGQTRWVLIGYGAIGRQVARRIKPFGVHLTAVKRSPAVDDNVDQIVGLADLGRVLPDADVVVLACALNDETRDLVGERFLSTLKPGAILINIARGSLIDEDALRRGLDRDQPGHAVLDVFRTEPLPPDSWLWSHPKVTVTAHTSNAGDGNIERGDELFLKNLALFLAGEPLLNQAAPAEVGLV